MPSIRRRISSPPRPRACSLSDFSLGISLARSFVHSFGLRSAKLSFLLSWSPSPSPSRSLLPILTTSVLVTHSAIVAAATAAAAVAEDKIGLMVHVRIERRVGERASKIDSGKEEGDSDSSARGEGEWNERLFVTRSLF